MNKQDLIEHIMGLAEQWAEHFAWGNSADKQEAALREFMSEHIREPSSEPFGWILYHGIDRLGFKSWNFWSGAKRPEIMLRKGEELIPVCRMMGAPDEGK